jgi:hypothetical protein
LLQDELAAMAEHSERTRLLFWVGQTQAEMGTIKLTESGRQLWLNARDGNWDEVLKTIPVRDHGYIEKCWPMANAFCPFHGMHYSFLHFAAYLGAPTEVVERLLEMGAWRSLQNAIGERALDVAAKRNHGHLLGILQPEYKRHVPIGILLNMQQHFHVALADWDNLHRTFEKYALRLPQLEPMLEVDRVKFRFEIEHWSGGFTYELAEDGLEPRLICVGYSRVSGGTEGKIEVTPAGVKHLPFT